MRRKGLACLLGLIFAVTASGPSRGESRETIQETPPAFLFHIERSRDADQVFYEAVTDREGNFDLSEPIIAYWVRHGENGKKEPLTAVQRKFSYGLKILDVINPERAVFRFACTDQRTFVLKKTPEGDFKVFSKEDNMMKLHKMYVYFSGGTYWMPIIGRIDLYLKDPESGTMVVESFKP